MSAAVARRARRSAPPARRRRARVRRAARRCRDPRRGGRVALVPTMGALHEGHARARPRRPGGVGADDGWSSRSSSTRLQFGPGEDLDRYPRTLDADLEAVRRRAASTWSSRPRSRRSTRGGDAAGHRRARAARRRCSRARPGPATSAACSPSSPSCSAWSGPTSRCSARRTTSSSRWSGGWSRDLCLGVDVVGGRDGPRGRRPGPVQPQPLPRPRRSAAAAAALSRALRAGAAAGPAGADAVLAAAHGRPGRRADGVELDYLALTDPDLGRRPPHGAGPAARRRPGRLHPADRQRPRLTLEAGPMLRTMMKSKIHRATVTQADLHYVGSVTVDADLLDAADLLPGELVAHRRHHQRRPAGDLHDRGRARQRRHRHQRRRRHLVHPGDLVILISLRADGRRPRRGSYSPRVVYVDADNRIVEHRRATRPTRVPRRAACSAATGVARLGARVLLCARHRQQPHHPRAARRRRRSCDHWRVATDERRTADEWGVLLQALLGAACSDETRSRGVAVCCTVPAVLPRVATDAGRYHPEVPVVVVEPGVRTGVPVHMDNPREVGSDRIVNALAAAELYDGPVDRRRLRHRHDLRRRLRRRGSTSAAPSRPGIEISLEALGQPRRRSCARSSCSARAR